MVNTTKISATKGLLEKLIRDYSPLTMYNALRAEDMVLMDIICREFTDIKIFAVDTGRLPAESHRLLQQIRRSYGDALEIYYPNAYELQAMVKTQGTNGIFDNRSQRLNCCAARVTHPIRRAISGKTAWLRGSYPESYGQSQDLKLLNYDFQQGIPLLCPLFQWTTTEIWSYIKQYEIPYHSLYDRKFTVIGCEPCTRAAGSNNNSGESMWWWEKTTDKTAYPDLYIA